MNETDRKALGDASEGLLFTSETDAPFEVIGWGEVGADLGDHDVLRLSGHPGGDPIARVDLDEFFGQCVQDREWFGEREKQDARRFRDLVEVLRAKLHDVRVYRVGEAEADVYIVGKADSGEWAGLKTRVVQT